MAGFDDFMWAIGQQESGGNYMTVNRSSGALGKYQIMPGNVPYWSQKYLGVSWTPEQFLYDATKQEALARAVLGAYYQQFGPRGAAAAWYSGNPGLANDYGSQPGGPSVGLYVDQVVARMGSNPGNNPDTAVATHLIDGRAQDTATPGVNSPSSSQMGAVDTSQMGAATGNVGAVIATGADAASGTGSEAPGEGKTASASSLLPADGMGAIIPTTPTDPSGSGRQKAVYAATKWLGTPYVWGGGNQNGPTANGGLTGFDCSGLVQYALAQGGISMPRLSYDQLRAGTHVAINQLQPGDLVGFGDGGHIAIYGGNNQIIEAPNSNGVVRIRDLSPGEDAWGVSLNALYT